MGREITTGHRRLAAVPDYEPQQPTCVLIACHNGADQIGAAVAQAKAQAPVFVVSDGSTDRTAEVAKAAGAEVLVLTENIGKPAAIARALRQFNISRRFATVAIIDDDTRIEPDFIVEAMRKMRAGVAIVVGTTKSDWSHDVRWNPWVAARAFAYWKYQLFIRRGQSALNVMNCIAGSNSLYRTSVLDKVVSENTPYIVDDTYWTLETHRRKLGKIVYAPKAVAHVQDPTTMRDWYRQNLRWLWGTMQGIRGHGVGRKISLFDLTYLGVIADWILYVVAWPAMLGVALAMSTNPWRTLVFYLLGYSVWAAIGAIALRRWRLLALAPMLVLVDWVQRVNFVHALIKAIRQPTVDSCKWASPPRYAQAA
jgi:cellulose synthase/poly-beta-1,6-N-acetylglucosamine synthase-like glycosyltransferase